MAHSMRMLSGTILPSIAAGTVTITFESHTVSGDGTGRNLVSHGAGEFIKRPCRYVGVKKLEPPNLAPRLFFSFKKRKTKRVKPPEFYVVSETVRKDRMTISWQSPKDTAIREISYMVMGSAKLEVEAKVKRPKPPARKGPKPDRAPSTGARRRGRG